MKVKITAPYLGETGYNYHAYNLARSLSNYCEVKVRTYSNNNQKLDKLDRDLLYELISIDKKNQIHTKRLQDIEFNPDIEIVLACENHWPLNAIQDSTAKIKIAYCVFESTLLTPSFVNLVKLKYDYFAVVSNWAKEVLINNNYPEDRILVFPEGIPEDVNQLSPISGEFEEDFYYTIIGKWEIRKSTDELIRAFLDAFPKYEDNTPKNVKLILNADNLFSSKYRRITKKTLEDSNLYDDRIMIKNHLSRKDYLNLLTSTNVFLSCSKAEGWNIPLMEAEALGIPSIYSDYSAQLEFSKGPLKVSTSGMMEMGNHIGKMAIIDHDDLVHKIKIAYSNYAELYNDYQNLATDLKCKFNWSTISGAIHDQLCNLSTDNLSDMYSMSFNDGAVVNIYKAKGKYNLKLFNNETNELISDIELSSGKFGTSDIKYYYPWRMELTNLETGESDIKVLDLKDKVVLIQFRSSAIGDTISWIPYIQRFKDKYHCDVYVSTFHNYLFEETYPDLKFIKPGLIPYNCYATYFIGFFYSDDGKSIKLNMNKLDAVKLPLQRMPCEILNIEYTPERAKIADFGVETNDKPYICIAPMGTAKRKLWNNPSGWQSIVDFFIEKGYEVFLLSKEPNGYNGIYYPDGVTTIESKDDLKDVIRLLKGAKMFLGIGSGLSWLSWALGVDTVLISGFSEPYCEMPEDDHLIRIFTYKDKCKGCFNKTLWDRDWANCPNHKGSNREFECTKSITSGYVINKIIEKFKI